MITPRRNFLEKDLEASGGKNSLAAMCDKSARIAIARGIKISFGTGVGPFHTTQRPSSSRMAPRS
jgi:hypothetical protein